MTQSQPAAQYVARISPKRPANAPSNVIFPWMEGLGWRRQFSAENGFVTVRPDQAQVLKRIHCDGELPERGGAGPLLFDVMTTTDAQRIIAIEQQQALLASAGQNGALRAALAGAGGMWTAQDFANLGIAAPAGLSAGATAADIVRKQLATPESASSGEAAPGESVPVPVETTKRVGRRPPKGKAPLPEGGSAT